MEFHVEQSMVLCFKDTMARKTQSEHSKKQKMLIGLRLGAVRGVSALTQGEFATAMGQNRLTYRKWEEGGYYPNIDAMDLVCSKFAVDYNFLFAGDYKGLRGDLAVQILQKMGNDMAKKENAAQKETIERVMHEAKHGELKTAGGKKVKNPKQAIAIALHEAGASRDATPAENKKTLKKTKTKEARGATGQVKAKGKKRAKG